MIRQPLVLLISGVLLVVAAGFAVNRFLFLHTAQHTSGRVVSLQARDARCGGGKRRSSRPCTKYTAQVELAATNGNRYTLEVSAGSKRGRGNSVEYADYDKGDAVPVIYDPDSPSTAYYDSFFGVWGTPIWLTIAQIATFFGSFMEPRRRSITE